MSNRQKLRSLFSRTQLYLKGKQQDLLGRIIRSDSCLASCCLLLPLTIVALLNVIMFSIRWKKQCRVQIIYFCFCFLTVFGSVLLVGAGCYQKAAQLGSDLYFVGAIMFSFLLIFVLCSFSTVLTAACYLLTMSILLFFSILFSNALWSDIDKFQTITNIPYANSIKSLIVISHIFIMCGCTVNLALSIAYHWLIYEVGASTHVCCIIKCEGGFFNCFLCCENREKRLFFNNVTLYHQTRADSADTIVQSQTFKPGTEGMAGGGIYFATKPPSTEGKARVERQAEKKMLQATVRLGKILRVSGNGITGYLPGMNRATTCSEMINYLDGRGYDSIWIPRERPEFVVYQPDQVVDIREVNY